MVALTRTMSWCEQAKGTLCESSLQNSCNPLTRMMAAHPEYLASFTRTETTLMDDGPLPHPYRHYIAIIAAARHHCSYLIRLHRTEFIRCGGDSRWLESLHNVPTKLRNLQEINRLLAHRPWRVTSTHIESLCHRAAPIARWSLSELMHAVSLLTHFHALCSAVYGSEARLQSESSALSRSDGESNSDSDSDSVESLVEMLCEQQDSEESSLNNETREEKSQTQDLSFSKANLSSIIELPEFTHVDFSQRIDKSISRFHGGDYAWGAQGFCTATRLNSDIAQALDEKFRIAQEPIRGQYEQNGRLCSPEFRLVLWNFSHMIMGIKHDDYNYKEVDELLEPDLKAFVKLLTSQPELLNKQDLDTANKAFHPSEKVHITILLLEARMQAELLYALRAIQDYSSASASNL